MTDTQIIQRAIDRARGRSASVHFEKSYFLADQYGNRSDEQAFYYVSSASFSELPKAYQVTVIGPEYHCTCPGASHPCCWHRCAVMSLRLSRSASGRPADGPSYHDETNPQGNEEDDRAAVASLRLSRLAHGLPADGPSAEDAAATVRQDRTVHADVPGYAHTLATVQALFDR